MSHASSQTDFFFFATQKIKLLTAQELSLDDLEI